MASTTEPVEVIASTAQTEKDFSTPPPITLTDGMTCPKYDVLCTAFACTSADECTG